MLKLNNYLRRSTDKKQRGKQKLKLPSTSIRNRTLKATGLPPAETNGST